MTRHYYVLPAADQDLDDQAAYLATEASVEMGLRFYDATSITFGNIASMPSIGKPWPSANERLAGLRVWRVEAFENYLIFYRIADTGIEIIRIIQAALDIDCVLESGSPQ
jgi:toxin ParE1/3/4